VTGALCAAAVSCACVGGGNNGGGALPCADASFHIPPAGVVNSPDVDGACEAAVAYTFKRRTSAAASRSGGLTDRAAGTVRGAAPAAEKHQTALLYMVNLRQRVSSCTVPHRSEQKRTTHREHV
jgi:hypothetical protein